MRCAVASVAWLSLCVAQPVLAADPRPDRPAVAYESVPSEVALNLLRAFRSVDSTERTVRPDVEAVLARFYRARNYEPVWISPFGLTGAGLAASALIAEAEGHGLAASAYWLPPEASAPPEGVLRPDAQFLNELAVARSLARFVVDLRFGRVGPPEEDEALAIARKDVDPVGLLEDIVADPVSGTKTVAPPTRGYRDLVRALEAARGIARDEPPAVPAGPLVRPGESDRRVPALRERLRWLGDMPAGEADGVPAAAIALASANGAFMPATQTVEQTGGAAQAIDETLRLDAETVTALRRFQARHGLEVDGIVGPNTLAQLNMSRQRRIDQVIANLERERWQPETETGRQVIVNVPEFRMEAREDGRTVLDMKVIVGRKDRPTPLFHDRIRYLEFNPTWTIPTSIAVKDIAPAMVEDPDYIERKNITVYYGWGESAPVVDPQAIDWSSVRQSSFPYRLEQAPGPENALGQVKFMFPNRFAVYLHDTPTQKLFQPAERAFSSGCVRVAEPRDFAYWLLGERFSPERVDGFFARTDTHNVGLVTPVPVSLVYRTAWVGADGRLQFRADLYGRDAALIARLDGQAF